MHHRPPDPSLIQSMNGIAASPDLLRVRILKIGQLGRIQLSVNYLIK